MIAYGVHHQRYLDPRLRCSSRRRNLLSAAPRADAERVEQERTDLLRAVAHELRTPLTAAAAWLISAPTANTPIGSKARFDGLACGHRAAGALPPVRCCRRGKCQQQNADRPGGLTPTAAALAPGAAEKRHRPRRCASPAALVVMQAEYAECCTSSITCSRTPITRRRAGESLLRSLWDRRSWPAVWLSVTDTGIGMSEDVRRQIFDKFYRAPQARLRVVRGFGLGLYLVQRVVMAHNGWVEVESTPGVGSAFRWLPRAADIAGDMTHGGDAATASGRRGGGAAGGGD
ncbi:MAG: ATP-binding protein [Dehalococcoidia bacterium]